jgi:cytochrome c peroxidase
VLFYDPILSADSTISCASCHSPYNAFAHSDHELSHGIHDQIGTRNAPALFNLAWQKEFMLDGAIDQLETQVIFPITHPKEMGETMESLVKKMNASAAYKKLFNRAFNDSVVTDVKILKALTQFQLTLVSCNSRYDKVKKGKASFNSQETKGYELFLKNCNVCHTEPMFTNYKFANNGLSANPALNDLGRGSVTHQSADNFLFKVPTLRNLSFTYPYMHDGRFNKIQSVINHYTIGIQPGKNLSAPLQQPIQLTSNDKVDLLAFLLTLNDTAFLFDRKFQFEGSMK